MQLRQAHPDLFYGQEWFVDEPFMARSVDEPLPTPAAHLVGVFPDDRPLPLAVALTWGYVLDPLNPIWDRWFWCADRDKDGQRVYVGRRNGLWEIHRHLHITARWGVAA
jgi:hypothetical protein